MVGTLLSGRYEILELVGSGGMANVYKARCTYLNRYVAIKVLKDEFKNDEEFLKRFNIESQAAAGLSHSNIVSVFDIGSENDIHYIVMEYVEGVTLKEYLSEHGALSCDEVIDFSIQIVSALNQAHRKGIIHRDIKPQNIIVTKDNVLKVTDFGIARAVSTYTMKIDDGAMGTVHYCSPEQARGGYTDEKSDIYSLGVVMYEMLTGKLPFESDNSVSVALKHMQEEAVPPSEIVENIPPKMEEIIKRAMMKNQNERFQTAGELLVELKIIKMDNEDVFFHADDEFHTKKIDANVVENELNNIKKSKKKDGKKDVKNASLVGSTKKEDKLAIIAGIGASIVVVAVFAFLAITVLFPGSIFLNQDERGEIEVPELIGVDFDKAKASYNDIKINENERIYSSEFDEGIIIEQDPDSGTMIKQPYIINVTVSQGPQIIKMPDVENMDYREAEIKLNEAKISYSVEFENHDSIPENTVIETNPAPGKKIKVGIDKVVVIVSAGTEAFYPVVPAVIDMNQSDAERKLAGINLIVKTEFESSDIESKGRVIKQSIKSGLQVAEKSVIIITIGTGPSEETSDDVPNTSENDVPVTSEDNKPSASESVEPNVTENNKPSVSENVTPSATEVKKPSVSEDVTPSATEDEKPGVSESVAPSAPEVEKPSVSENVTPSAPEVEKPSVSESVAPSAPEVENPSVPEDVAPSVAVNDELVATEDVTSTVTEAETPSVSEPEKLVMPEDVTPDVAVLESSNVSENEVSVSTTNEIVNSSNSETPATSE